MLGYFMPSWLAVEPTPFEKYESKWESSQNRGENKNIFETTTQLATFMSIKSCTHFQSHPNAPLVVSRKANSRCPCVEASRKSVQTKQARSPIGLR